MMFYRLTDLFYGNFHKMILPFYYGVSWADFDESSNATGINATVIVRTTDDDPAGSPTWSDWQKLDSAEFYARGFDFHIVLITDTLDYNINVTELEIEVEEVS